VHLLRYEAFRNLFQPTINHLAVDVTLSIPKSGPMSWVYSLPEVSHDSSPLKNDGTGREAGFLLGFGMKEGI